MRKETLDKANNIIEKLERIESILQVLNAVEISPLQKDSIKQDEDMKTCLSLWVDDKKHLREDKTPFPELHFTKEHIEVMKSAFEKRKEELNTEFVFL